MQSLELIPFSLSLTGKKLFLPEFLIQVPLATVGKGELKLGGGGGGGTYTWKGGWLKISRERERQSPHFSFPFFRREDCFQRCAFLCETACCADFFCWFWSMQSVGRKSLCSILFTIYKNWAIKQDHELIEGLTFSPLPKKSLLRNWEGVVGDGKSEKLPTEREKSGGKRQTLLCTTPPTRCRYTP